jgi:hypothetical protein
MLNIKYFLDEKGQKHIKLQSYCGYAFSEKDLPLNLAGCTIDETSLKSILNLHKKGLGHKILLRGSSFYNIDFSKHSLDLSQLDMTGVIFQNCIFDETKIENSILKFTSFLGCSFFDTKLLDNDLFRADFSLTLGLTPKSVHANYRATEAIYGAIQNDFVKAVAKLQEQTSKAAKPKDKILSGSVKLAERFFDAPQIPESSKLSQTQNNQYSVGNFNRDFVDRLKLLPQQPEIIKQAPPKKFDHGFAEIIRQQKSKSRAI